MVAQKRHWKPQSAHVVTTPVTRERESMQPIGIAAPWQLSGELPTKVQPITRLQLWFPLDP